MVHACVAPKVSLTEICADPERGGGRRSKSYAAKTWLDHGTCKTAAQDRCVGNSVRERNSVVSECVADTGLR